MRFHFAALLFGEQRDGGALDGCVARLHHAVRGKIRNEADALGRFHADMPAKAAGEIEDLDLVEIDAVFAEDGVQTRGVGALGLRQFIDVAFEKVDAVLGRDLDARRAIGEAAHLVHAAGAQAVRSRARPGPIRRCLAGAPPPITLK